MSTYRRRTVVTRDHPGEAFDRFDTARFDSDGAGARILGDRWRETEGEDPNSDGVQPPK